MDNFVDGRDQKLLERDKCTFFVLQRILGGACKLILTDHERTIICFSCDPYPVWIWTADDASEEEMERTYQLVSAQPLFNGKRFNLKRSLAEFFIARAAAEGKTLSVITDLFAYDCPCPKKPIETADGSFCRCTEGDLEVLTDVIEEFHREIATDMRDRGAYRMDAEASIRVGNAFFWKNGAGEIVSCCRYVVNGDMASIGLVITRSAFRRRHYAQNLVYEVTKMAADAGYLPMLYTDGNYAASNACYAKIGYVLRGKLCTIG